MGRRKGLMLSLITILCASMLTTLFSYMVYSMHYDSAADDLTGLLVFDYRSEPGVQSSLGLDSLYEDLSKWASEYKAVILYKGFSAAGIAALDYAGWFDETLQIPFSGQVSKVAIVQSDNENSHSYSEGDLLFPQNYKYRIVGEFQSDKAPVLQGDAFFYFPLSDITEMQGLLFTNIKDESALALLIRNIEFSGRHVEYQTYKDNNLSFVGVIKNMLLSDFISRSMLFTFLGLQFCGVFAVFLMYRELNRFMNVHHLYGASLPYLYTMILSRLVLVSIVGTIVGYILSHVLISLINKSAYFDLAIMSSAYNMIYILLLNTAGFYTWKNQSIVLKRSY